MQEQTIILLCFSAGIGFGAETPVQMATLRWNGDGEFMSWRWEKLDEAFGDGAARFAANAEKRATRPRSVRKALTSPKSGTGRARKVSYSLAALPAAPLPDARADEQTDQSSQTAAYYITG